MLNYNIKYIDDDDEQDSKAKLIVPLKTSSEKVSSVELLNDLGAKTLKYSIMAITNILIKTDKTDLIFFRKLSILQILQEHCQFEHNP